MFVKHQYDSLFCLLTFKKWLREGCLPSFWPVCRKKKRRITWNFLKNRLVLTKLWLSQVICRVGPLNPYTRVSLLGIRKPMRVHVLRNPNPMQDIISRNSIPVLVPENLELDAGSRSREHKMICRKMKVKVCLNIPSCSKTCEKELWSKFVFLKNGNPDAPNCTSTRS